MTTLLTPSIDEDMTDETTIEHLFTEPIRESMGGPSYGDWRSISAPDAVSLSYGFPYPDSLPNDQLIEAAEAVFEAEGDQALQYGGGEYVDRLAADVAARARERGIDCTESEVLLTNGATKAIDTICRAFLSPGDAIFVEAPTFMGALTLFENFGVEVAGFPVDSDGLDVDAVAAALRGRRREGRPIPKLLYTIPTFQNPTGTTMPVERRRRLLELAAEYDFVVLEDDAYGQLRYDGEDVPTMKAIDEEGRVLQVGTFAKTIAPGVRTGWILGPEAVVGELARIDAGGTNTFTRSVVGRYCTDGTLDSTVPELRAAYERRRDRMLEALEASMPPEASWTEPEGGFFVWVELPPGIDADRMLPEAAEEGVTYLPGEFFFPDDAGERCLRLSFSHVSVAEIDRAIEALGRATRSALAARSADD